MAACDGATRRDELIFNSKKRRILFLARAWSLEQKEYLKAVLEQLGLMTAWYSYGNGDLAIEKSKLWIVLDSRIVVPMINEIIRPILKTDVSDEGQFPEVLWFEQECCWEDENELRPIL